MFIQVTSGGCQELEGKEGERERERECCGEYKGCEYERVPGLRRSFATVAYVVFKLRVLIGRQAVVGSGLHSECGVR